MATVTCPYCKGSALLVTGKTVYPHRKDLHHLKLYRCPPCDAHVGCHKESGEPFGRLADAKLRKAKMEAHNIFDPIWKKKRMSRRAAYAWLAGELKIETSDCHIGMFDAETCEKVVTICRKKRRKMRL